MEKALEILEKYVQWIALGLGLLFLGWTAYAYVLTPPAVVTVDGRKVVAGEMEPLTNSGPVRLVKSELASTANPGFATPDIVTSWRGRMDAPAGIKVALDWPFNALIPASTGTHDDHLNGQVNITAVPVLPKAVPQAPMTGLSVVTLQVPNPAAAAAGGGVQPVAQPATEDLDWVTAWATIPADALAKSFSAPLQGQNMTPELLAVYKTAMLNVTLQRQHATGTDASGKPVFPTGEQGVEEVHPLAAYNDQLKAIPAETAGIQEKFDYVTWAQANATLLTTPDFYVVTAGTPWTAPQANPATPAVTQPAPTPGTPPAAPAATTPKASAGNATGSPVAARAMASYAPYDARRPAGAIRGDNFGAGPGGLATPNSLAAPPGNFAGPTGVQGAGAIDPLAPQQPDVTLWAHDETVKPGETYRYRFIYTLKNPVFSDAGMADPKLVAQLAVVSPPSDWSDPVTTPEKTKFWLANINHEQAKFDVFQWSNGAWKSTKPTLTAGDLVPGTNWTLVDVRASDLNRQRDKYVLLANDLADMSRRDQAADANDPAHQDLITQVNGPPAAPPETAPPATPSRRPVPSRGGRTTE